MILTLPSASQLAATYTRAGQPFLPFAVGELFIDRHEVNAFRFVKNNGPALIPATTLAAWDGNGSKRLGNVRLPAASVAMGTAGVALAAIAPGDFGFVRVRGLAPCLVGGAIPAGSETMMDTLGRMVPLAAGGYAIGSSDTLDVSAAGTSTMRIRAE